jgi:SulP family sulfate permease
VGEKGIPRGVEVYEINGPFFFGVADTLKDTLRHLERPPRVFILRMRYVPYIDATGMHALEEFFDKCRREGMLMLLCGVHVRPLVEMTRSGLLDRLGFDNVYESLDLALARARTVVGPAAG